MSWIRAAAVARLLGLAVAGALATASCQFSATLHAEELGVLDEGEKRTYLVRAGESSLLLACALEGSDRRTLDGVDGVPFEFVYGTPEGYDHPTCKSIWARTPDGPRLAYLDAWLWKLELDPPLPLVPWKLQEGREWEWGGRAELDGRALGPARLTVTVLERLQTRNGPLDTARIEQEHAASGVRITWWFGVHAGLIRVDVAEPGAPVRSMTWVGLVP